MSHNSLQIAYYGGGNHGSQCSVTLWYECIRWHIYMDIDT